MRHVLQEWALICSLLCVITLLLLALRLSTAASDLLESAAASDLLDTINACTPAGSDPLQRVSDCIIDLLWRSGALRGLWGSNYLCCAPALLALGWDQGSNGDAVMPSSCGLPVTISNNSWSVFVTFVHVG